MFVKPFKIKSNVQLRGSDLKKFRLRVEENFPLVKEIDLNTLFPSKSNLSQIKTILHTNNQQCIVYSVDKCPLFFEDINNRDSLIPTVYTLWMVPDIVPYFTTYTAVLPKLANGADLMLPGVIRRESGMNAYGRYKKDQLVGVNLTSNCSAVGVGRLAKSSDDLYMSAGHGICVKIFHVFGDKLWNLEPTITRQIPDNKPVIETPSDDDFPELGAQRSRVKKQTEVADIQAELATVEENNATVEENNATGTLENQEKTDDNDNSNQIELMENENKIEQGQLLVIEENMDVILKNAFLKALKTDGRNLNLPILSSNFYRNHIIPAATKQIDLKQTTYKKISKFLNEMSKEGLISVSEETKGVEKITSINLEHSDIINFIPTSNSNDVNDGKCNKNGIVQLFHTQMTELYTVTNATIALWTQMNYNIGDGIPAQHIKKLLKEYISKNKLQTIDNVKRIIKLDKILSEICNKQDECTFDEIYTKCLDKMNHTFEMVQNTKGIGGANKMSSSSKPPIQMSLATRSGNKKVTLVRNLESYGIILSEFSRLCKVGAAASTSLVKTPNSKCEQLQIQGNQIRFVHNLLTERYNIQPRQIIGLDLAKKEKKKRS